MQLEVINQVKVGSETMSWTPIPSCPSLEGALGAILGLQTSSPGKIQSCGTDSSQHGALFVYAHLK